MTLLTRLFFLFTPFILLLAGASFVLFCHTLNWLYLLGFFFSLYGLPVITYRLHQWILPVEEGISYLNYETYSSWFVCYHLQSIYYFIPLLESLLRLIPGLFSLWLRLWGAKIGKNVFWTPQIAISDRGFIEIGDNVFFGNWVRLVSHLATPKKDQLRLYIKTISIGNNVFIGGESFLAPGVAIEDGTIIAGKSDCYPTKDKIKEIIRESSNSSKNSVQNESNIIA